MTSITVELSSIAGTGATLGWAGEHTLVVDRPDGRAGGKGLGFNGGQLLALAIGGCLCNDLHYAAHGLNVRVGKIAVKVNLDLGGDPLVARSARVEVHCEMLDGTAPDAVIARAREISTVLHSVQGGFAVTIENNAQQEKV